MEKICPMDKQYGISYPQRYTKHTYSYKRQFIPSFCYVILLLDPTDSMTWVGTPHLSGRLISMYSTVLRVNFARGHGPSNYPEIYSLV